MSVGSTKRVKVVHQRLPSGIDGIVSVAEEVDDEVAMATDGPKETPKMFLATPVVEDPFDWVAI
jgi:hypothetical protein